MNTYRIPSIACLFLGIVLSPSCLAAGFDVEVDGFTDANVAGLTLYSSRFSFPDKPRETQRAGIYQGATEFHFDDLPPGDYAILVWGDKDEDGDFDRSMFGNPKESFVFSNSVYEPEPEWDAVRFTIGGDRSKLTLTVREP